MIYKLYIQIPKKKKKVGIIGGLAISTTTGSKEAMFFNSNEILVASMNNPEIIFINAHGILLKGYEPTTPTKTGQAQFRYQEWFCAFKGLTGKE